jgi:uncharacterized membrane protein
MELKLRNARNKSGERDEMWNEMGMLMEHETMNKWLVAQDIKQVKAIITRVRKLTQEKQAKTNVK